MRLRLRHDRQIGAPGQQQAHRIGMEAGHDVQLHRRPVLAEAVHRRHQPVEAGMALHRDAQLAGLALA
ncbi:hypothetical protein D3C85_1837120 [compost metagenome]